MMGGWMHGMGWGWLLLILVLVAIVVAVMLASRSGWSSGSRPNGDKNPPGAATRSAEEILKERYARGEITREEYEQMRRDLQV